MVNDVVLEKVIDGNEDAKEICLLLRLVNKEENIAKLSELDIIGKRAANLYYLSEGDPELVDLSLQFIESGIVPLKDIHKRLDSASRKPIVNRKKENDETLEEYLQAQAKECWGNNRNNNKIKR